MAGSYDSGYAWLVVVGSFVVHFITCGMGWTLGIFYVMILNNVEHHSSAEVAFILSLNAGVTYLSGTLAGLLCKRFGFRLVGMTGGLLSSLGFILSSFANSIFHLYITFGFMTGCGLGLSYLPGVTIVGFYFKRFRAIAYGIAVSGVGLGSFALPPIIRYIEDSYDWRSTFLLTGGICLQLVVSCALFKENDISTVKHEDKASSKNSVGDKDVEMCHVKQENHPSQKEQTKNETPKKKNKLSGLYLNIFLNPSYAFLAVHCSFIWMGLTTVSINLPPYVISVGYSKNQGALLVSIAGITNMVGRLVYGGLSSLRLCSHICLYVTGFLGAGICAASVTLSDNFIWMCCCAAGFGFLWGTYGPTFPEIIMQYLDLSLLTVGYGYCMLFMAIGTLGAGPLSGYLLDKTQSYPITLYLGGGALLIGALIMFIPWICFDTKKKPANVIVEDGTKSEKNIIYLDT